MGKILEVFRVIREERLAFGVFLGVNLFFGGMALWLPPAVATQHASASPWSDFLTALQQGNGYLFALALLAATTSNWIREQIDTSNGSDFKSLKMGTSLFAGAVMILMAIFLGNMLSTVAAGATISSSAILTQIVFTIVAFVTAVYLFCLEHIDDYPEYGKALKDRTTKNMEAGMDGTSKTGFRT